MHAGCMGVHVPPELLPTALHVVNFKLIPYLASIIMKQEHQERLEGQRSKHVHASQTIH